MTELSEDLLAYHQRSKHRVNRYAPGPTGLDWANQPDPFREFQGAVQLKLQLAADSWPPATTSCASATCRPCTDSTSII